MEKTVRCYFCGNEIPEETAHIGDNGEYYCDERCETIDAQVAYADNYDAVFPG